MATAIESAVPAAASPASSTVRPRFDPSSWAGAVLKLTVAGAILAILAPGLQAARARFFHPDLAPVRLKPVFEASTPFVGRPHSAKIDVTVSRFRFTDNWRMKKGRWQVEVLWLVDMVNRDTVPHVASVDFFLDDDDGLRVASLGSATDAVQPHQETNFIRGHGWVDAGLLPLIPTSTGAIDWEFRQAL